MILMSGAWWKQEDTHDAGAVAESHIRSAGRAWPGVGSSEMPPGTKPHLLIPLK